MNTPASSAALPVAHVVLRILVVVNWLTGAAILVLLFISPNREWIISAFELTPSLDAERVIFGLRAIAVIGLLTVPLHYTILKRLLAMVETVRAGDPFVAENAHRLETIAWIAARRCKLVGLVIARSPRPSRRRRIRSISMPAFRSTAGSPCSSRSCWPACSRKARGCATTSKGRSDVASSSSSTTCFTIGG